MGFKELLLKAKSADDDAALAIVAMYKPLVTKSAIIDGRFDEDLYQELLAALMNCIRKIKQF